MEQTKREPGDCFRSKAYGITWYSVQGKSGIAHHRRTKEEQLKLSDKYKQGNVSHGLMELEI